MCGLTRGALVIPYVNRHHVSTQSCYRFGLISSSASGTNTANTTAQGGGADTAAAGGGVVPNAAGGIFNPVNWDWHGIAEWGVRSAVTISACGAFASDIVASYATFGIASFGLAPTATACGTAVATKGTIIQFP